MNIKKLVFLFIMAGVCSLFAQSPLVKSKIRFSLWADIDAYPGITAETPENKNSKKEQNPESAYEKPFAYPIKRIKEIAPMLIEGMVYGWEFSYIPYDKTRGVEEYIEIKEIVPASYIEKKVQYSEPWIEENMFNCWCEYNKNDYEMNEYERWSVIQNPVISGVGYGSVADGFSGIEIGIKDSLKNALKEYYRNVIKNKPKEITGKVLVKSIPLIGIDSGRYVINLDFFLERGKIIEYKVF